MEEDWEEEVAVAEEAAPLEVRIAALINFVEVWIIWSVAIVY